MYNKLRPLPTGKLTQKKEQLLSQANTSNTAPEDLKIIKAEINKTMRLLKSSRNGLTEAKKFLIPKITNTQYTYSRHLKRNRSNIKKTFIKCL